MIINLNLTELLTKAWKITWKFKVLWIFGILAGCANSNNGNFNFNNSNWNSNNDLPGSSGQLPDWLRKFQDLRPEQALRSALDQYAVLIVGVLLALCVLWLVFFCLGMIGRAGLIKGAASADSGTESLTFGGLWSESLPYFWRLLGISLLVGLPFFVMGLLLLVVLGLGVFTTLQGGHLGSGGVTALIVGLGGVLMLLLCVIGLLGVLVGLIVEQAQNALVLENLGVLPGLLRGWQVFRQNWLTVVVVGILQGVMRALLGLVVALPLVLALIPVVAGAAAAAAFQQWILLAVLICGCLLVWLPVSLLIGGVENTYFQTLWTLAFLRLTAVPANLPPAAAIESAEPQ